MLPDLDRPVVVGWSVTVFAALVIVAVFALLASAAQGQNKEVVCGVAGDSRAAADCRGDERGVVRRRTRRRVQESDAEASAPLTLAAMCWGESEASISDCIAELFVIEKRSVMFDVALLAMARQYSSPLRRKARRLQALRWGDVPGWPAARNEQWRRIRTIVVWFRAGLLEDPCPRAVHFGSVEDGSRGRMRLVDCGPTKNLYYEVR